MHHRVLGSRGRTSTGDLEVMSLAGCCFPTLRRLVYHTKSFTVKDLPIVILSILEAPL